MSGPVVEEPGGEAPRVVPVASRKLSSNDASAHVCPRVDVDPESGDAVYHPMCCGRVPARRWQLGICCFGPGGCTLFCSSVCLQGVASHAALSVVTWVGCAMAPVGLCQSALEIEIRIGICPRQRRHQLGAARGFSC